MEGNKIVDLVKSILYEWLTEGMRSHWWMGFVRYSPMDRRVLVCIMPFNWIARGVYELWLIVRLPNRRWWEKRDSDNYRRGLEDGRKQMNIQIDFKLEQRYQEGIRDGVAKFGEQIARSIRGDR